MAVAALAHPRLHIRQVLAVGPQPPAQWPSSARWMTAAHPVPDARSVDAAAAALELATGVGAEETLLILLSGGASSLMALPVADLTLADKQHTIRTLLLAGADIGALNTVRKHLSRVKGGQLAAACRGATVTLAISDVIGDDLAVIGSGPGVADPSTWEDAERVLDRHGGEHHLPRVRALVASGQRGERGETPKPGDAALARAEARVIASRPHALAAAVAQAEALGYTAFTLPGAVAGEARDAAATWLGEVLSRAERQDAPVCVLSAGETTVHVTGHGTGGRNQEFVLALVEPLARAGADLLVASIGSDGIDGPTDAAGALADRTSSARAIALGLSAAAALRHNDAYPFFAHLGDLILTGPTDTNVGDLQIALVTR